MRCSPGENLHWDARKHPPTYSGGGASHLAKRRWIGKNTIIL